MYLNDYSKNLTFKEKMLNCFSLFLTRGMLLPLEVLFYIAHLYSLSRIPKPG